LFFVKLIINLLYVGSGFHLVHRVRQAHPDTIPKIKPSIYAGVKIRFYLLHNKSYIEKQIFNGASPPKLNQGTSARKQKFKKVSTFFIADTF
jgi:hypothetical protein